MTCELPCLQGVTDERSKVNRWHTSELRSAATRGEFSTLYATDLGTYVAQG